MFRNQEETSVAQAMVASLIVGWTSADAIIPNDIIAHHFGLACEKVGLIPNEASARRILAKVSQDLNERRSAIDQLNAVLVRETRRLQRQSP